MSGLWFYGLHVCRMALLNPKRVVKRILVTNEATLEKLSKDSPAKIEIVNKRFLESYLSPGAVHQGIAMLVHPLENVSIEALDEIESTSQRVIVLDQVSDPHNVGAILRSAAAFGASALIMTDRHAPKESGVLAKSASGALEIVPRIVVNNLAQGITALKEMGFWCVGFSEAGTQTLGQIDLKGKIALIMGSEGDGMRHLTQKLCDFTAKLETVSDFSTLNVSNATAIALHETFKAQCTNI